MTHMTHTLPEIQSALRERGLCSYMQNGEQIVVSRQRGPAWPNRGNSFWIGRFGGEWFVVTWMPAAYRVPAEVSVVDVATAFVAVGDEAQHRIPADLVNRFGLTELGPDESRGLFESG